MGKVWNRSTRVRWMKVSVSKPNFGGGGSKKWRRRWRRLVTFGKIGGDFGNFNCK
jgi:hypothetical protein